MITAGARLEAEKHVASAVFNISISTLLAHYQCLSLGNLSGKSNGGGLCRSQKLGGCWLRSTASRCVARSEALLVAVFKITVSRHQDHDQSVTV